MEFSAIIPVYNGAEFLKETLRSLESQVFPFAEIIVVDDGSSDHTPTILSEYAGRNPKIKVFSLPHNYGVSHARNLGISQATSEWCLFWDADDIASPQLTVSYHRYLEDSVQSGRETDMLFCGSVQIDNSNQVISKPNRFITIEPTEYLGYLFVRNPIVTTSGVAVKREVIRSLGGFDRDLRYSEDWDLWLRIAANHSIGYLDEILVHVRRHAQNASAVIHNMQEGESKVLSKHDIQYIKESIFARKLPLDRNRLDYVSIAYKLGRWSEGYHELDKCLTPSGTHYFLKGLYFVEHSNFIDANSSFQTVLDFNPDHHAALNNTACCLWKLNCRDEAIRILKNLTHKRPDYIDAAHNLKQFSTGENSGEQIKIRFTWRELREALTHYIA